MRQRFKTRLIKLAKLGPTACWPWPGHIRPDGYGSAWKIGSNTNMTAHRRAYIETFGDPGSDFVIDHLCRNRACVNPSHLEAVTNEVNLKRGIAPTLIAHVTNTCLNGHPLLDDNVVIMSSGHRRCRVCLNKWHREYRAANPERSRAYEQKRKRPLNYWRDYERAHPNRKHQGTGVVKSQP